VIRWNYSNWFILRTINIKESWDRPVQNWGQVMNQLQILFSDRIAAHLKFQNQLYTKFLTSPDKPKKSIVSILIILKILK